MVEPLEIEINVEPNPGVQSGCQRRFKVGGSPRVVSRVRYFLAPDTPLVCEVSGWFGAGGVGKSCPAHAIPIDERGADPALLVYGGDWGLRLWPCSDGAGGPFAQPYLLISPSDLVA